MRRPLFHALSSNPALQQYRTRHTEHLLRPKSLPSSPLPALSPLSPLAFSWITGWAPAASLPPASLPCYRAKPSATFSPQLKSPQCHLPAVCLREGLPQENAPRPLNWTPAATLPSLPTSSLPPLPALPLRPSLSKPSPVLEAPSPLLLKGSAPAAPPAVLTFPLLSRHRVTASPPLSRSAVASSGRLLCLPPIPPSGLESSHDPLHFPHGQSVCVSVPHHAGPCFHFTARDGADNPLWVNERACSAPPPAPRHVPLPGLALGGSEETSTVLARRPAR